AALFMAVTKTLMKGIAAPGIGPCEVFKRVNAELAHDNEMMMFVTAFCGVLDLNTGELEYSNAGHLPPLVVRANGQVEKLELPAGAVLGVKDDADYSCRGIHLNAGDSLLLYTDGITESADRAGQFFGEERLTDLAYSLKGVGPEKAIHSLFEAAASFSSGAEQFDDMTALAVRYNGASGKEG
nr:PP2C family protein-serine/threonine phosphatase [Elusimicrobiales bacterium]